MAEDPLDRRAKALPRLTEANVLLKGAQVAIAGTHPDLAAELETIMDRVEAIHRSLRPSEKAE